MGYEVTEFQPTPNPNAVKCILDRVIRDPALGPASFRSAEAAQGDALAGALFAIPGVTNILINGDWITVGKQAGQSWPSVRAGIAGVLRSHG